MNTRQKILTATAGLPALVPVLILPELLQSLAHFIFAGVVAGIV